MTFAMVGMSYTLGIAKWQSRMALIPMILSFGIVAEPQ